MFANSWKIKSMFHVFVKTGTIFSAKTVRTAQKFKIFLLRIYVYYVCLGAPCENLLDHPFITGHPVYRYSNEINKRNEHYDEIIDVLHYYKLFNLIVE